MVTTSFGLTTLFVYCYFGKLATESHENMADCLYEMDWRKQPVKIQKYYILMIQNMQQPLHYHGFHVAVMNLRTFIKVSCHLYWINISN